MAQVSTEVRVRCESVRVGDVVVMTASHELVVAVIEPYTHPTLGETVGIVRDASGRGMTLFGGDWVHIRPRPSGSRP